MQHWLGAGIRNFEHQHTQNFSIFCIYFNTNLASHRFQHLRKNNMKMEKLQTFLRPALFGALLYWQTLMWNDSNFKVISNFLIACFDHCSQLVVPLEGWHWIKHFLKSLFKSLSVPQFLLFVHSWYVTEINTASTFWEHFRWLMMMVLA